MEKQCPKCGSMVEGVAPDDPWFMVYDCQECGYHLGEE